MRLFSTLAIVALAVTPVVATAQNAPAAPAAAAPAFSTAKTTLGVLLANSDTKAVLAKFLPNIVNNPQLAAAASFTVKDLQQFIPTVTDKVLADMDVELAKIPAPDK